MTIDEVLDKLIRDVEQSVHAFYRGDVRQNTQRVRTESFRNAARDSLQALIAESGDGSSSAPRRAGATTSLTRDEAIAATRCVMAWLPMGGAQFAVPEAKCIPAAREMMPTWGEREKARLALQRVAG